MIYPWMFDQYAVLRTLRAAADILARHEWPGLYGPDRLAAKEVSVAAAIYHDDFYVPGGNRSHGEPSWRLAALGDEQPRARTACERTGQWCGIASSSWFDDCFRRTTLPARCPEFAGETPDVDVCRTFWRSERA
jgi:hypothetical protein